MKLSIVIPAYNVENHIGNTLDSLINQTEYRFQIVVVDDGSTDKTFTIIKEKLESSNFNNFKIIQKDNGGVSSARNLGLTKAQGEYILFLDGDDYVSNNLVERILPDLDNQESDIIFWKFALCKDKKTIKTNFFDKYKEERIYFSAQQMLYNYINKTMIICTGSAVYKKDFLTNYKLQYTEGCVNGEDQEFTYKCLCNVGKILFINETLTYYVQRADSISNSFNIKRFDSVYALKRVVDYMEGLKNESLIDILSILENELIIKNYLGNINEYLRYLEKQKDFSKKGMDYIYAELEKRYPNLGNMMIENMKNYKGGKLKTFILIKVFLNSPSTYVRLINLVGTFRGLGNNASNIRKGG